MRLLAVDRFSPVLAEMSARETWPELSATHLRASARLLLRGLPDVVGCRWAARDETEAIAAPFEALCQAAGDQSRVLASAAVMLVRRNNEFQDTHSGS